MADINMNDTKESLVLAQQHDHTLWLQLNRGHAMNALSFDLVDALLQHLQQAQADDNIRVLVLTGSGKAFCAGADLKNLNEPRAPGEKDILDRVVDLLDTVRAFPKNLGKHRQCQLPDGV